MDTSSLEWQEAYDALERRVEALENNSSKGKAAKTVIRALNRLSTTLEEEFHIYLSVAPVVEQIEPYMTERTPTDEAYVKFLKDSLYLHKPLQIDEVDCLSIQRLLDRYEQVLENVA